MAQSANERPTKPHPKSAYIAGDPRFLMAGFALIAVAAFAVPRTSGLAVILLYTLFLHFAAGLSRASPTAKPSEATAVSMRV